MKRIHKKKILRIITTLNPEYGGPINAILHNSRALIKKGIKVDILTCDNKGVSYIKDKNITVYNMGPSLLGRYGFSLKLFFWLKNNKEKYDTFLIHGLWQFISLAARLLLSKNYYIFLHGQLDPFFKYNFFKLLKKKIYWILIEKNNLLNARSALLTSKGEKNSLKNTFVNFVGIKKKVVNYGIIKPQYDKKKYSSLFYKKFKELKNKNFYLFLGRYHEKKGCEIIIEAIHKFKKNFDELVLMIGPLKNTAYEKKIFNLRKKYNLDKKIIISDALYGNFKWAAISESKAMLLPSHGENFGVSIAESLCFSRPVLISNKVNIYKDIIKYDAGLVSKNSSYEFMKILKQFSKFNNKRLIKLRKNSQKCFNENYNLFKNQNELYNLINQHIYKIKQSHN